jgi:hypothetical protein
VEEREAPEPFIANFNYSLHPLLYESPNGTESEWKVGLAIHPDDDEPFTLVFDVDAVQRVMARVDEQLRFIEFNEGRKN